MDGGRRRPVARLAITLALVSIALDAAPALSFGIRYPDHVSVASGVRTDVVALLTGPRTSWSLEASNRELFGGVDLRVGGLRATIERKKWRSEVEVAAMTAGVGRETLVGVRVGPTASTWSASMGVAHETVSIESALPASLTTLSVSAGATLTGRVRVCCEVDGFRVAGIDYPGADVETGVTVTAASAVVVATAFVVDRSMGACARVAAAISVLDRAVVVAGYNEGNEALSLAVAVFTGGARGVVGASFHPVLGLSRGASVGWGR